MTKTDNIMTKSVVNMNSKSKIKYGVIIAIALIIAIVSIVLMGVMYQEKTVYRNALENRYQRGYMSLIDNVDDIEVGLSKLVATTSFDSQKSIMQNVYTSCVLASENISNIPVNIASLNNVNILVNKIGGYMYSLVENETRVCGDVLKSVEDLHAKISVVKYDINKGYSDGLNSAVLLSDVNNSTTDGSSFTAGLVSEEQSYSDVPTLIYDGPFSESVLNKEPKIIEEKITQEDAYQMVSELADYWSGYVIEYLGETNGKLDTYNYHLIGDNRVYLQVLQNGGLLLSATAYGDYDGNAVSTDQAIDIAKEIAYKFGYENMVDVWHQVVGSVVYINLAYAEDGVVYYSDLVKVKIDLNGGELVGWEATNYIYNHCDREEYVGAISIDDAQNLLSDSLDVVERSYCVVPNKYVGESCAYEYVCTWSGYTYYVYLDSLTGEELKVMRVIETDNGDLLE